MGIKTGLLKYAAFAGVALAVLGASAHAVVIGSASSNPYTFSWSSFGGGYTLAGTGSLSLSGFSSSLLDVNITLTNNTVAGGNPSGKDARLTSFGFGIDPNATGISFSDSNDGGMIGAALNIIPSLSTIEVCAFGGNNCSGGGNGGIYGNGGTDTFHILLSGTWGSSVNIDPIGFKYQTAALSRCKNTTLKINKLNLTSNSLLSQTRC